MKFVIQRVKYASVVVEEKVIGKIKKGFLVLIGISNQDEEKIADKMRDFKYAKKIVGSKVLQKLKDGIIIFAQAVKGQNI